MPTLFLDGDPFPAPHSFSKFPVMVTTTTTTKQRESERAGGRLADEKCYGLVL